MVELALRRAKRSTQPLTTRMSDVSADTRCGEIRPTRSLLSSYPAVTSEPLSSETPPLPAPVPLAGGGAGEVLFRQLADSLPQMVWMARPDGTLDYYNERWYEFTGLPRDRSGDESWQPILHPEDVQRCMDVWYASVRSGQPYEIEYRFFDRRSGAYRWHLGRALPLRDAEGRIVRWFGTCTDIDDQVRAEQVARFLAQASRTMSALVDYPTALQTIASLAVPDFADWCALDIVQPDGDLQRLALSHWDATSVDAARELERRYPSRPSDPVGPRAVLASGRSTLISDITDDMLVACAYDDEHLALLRGAGLRSCIAVPLTAGGAIVGVLTFLTSDSGRRYGPSDLMLAEELAYRARIAIENARLYSDLQQADRQKDEFLAVLAHELRNPLAPIRTALQLLRVAPDDRERRDRAMEVMERQLQQMVRLVDDLLDVSRITRGRIELQTQPIDLHVILQRAIETSRPLIEAAGHAFTVNYPPAPVTIDGDLTRLAQVFSNLLNNAAKYTPRGGRITLDADAHGDRAVVRVRDTGVGIPPGMLSGVFEMFTQVDRSLEKTQGGLGIGLTLVKRLVEMHGGTVDATSAGPGLGSEFIVSLPRLQSAGAAGGPSAPALSVPARRILVVDDNRDAADTLAEMLRLAGHDVRTAYDGLGAMAAAEEFTPDAVLLDLGMPRLSGYDAATRLRQRFGPALLLIATTGWGQDEHRRRSAEAGFDHHLVKPIEPAALDALLAAAPSSSR